MLSHVALVAFAANAAAAGLPTAVPRGEPPPAEKDVPAKIRSGIVLGVALGAGVGSGSGYPNDATQIGDPRYYSSSGWMAGTSSTLMLMGAITDYFSFGFWFAHAGFENAHWRSNGNGGGLRVEAFPFVLLYPPLNRLGFFGQFGIGGSNLVSKSPGVPESGGVQSFIGTGSFYEWSFGRLFGGHFGVGPSLEYDAVFSQPFERHGLVASARMVFYGGP